MNVQLSTLSDTRKSLVVTLDPTEVEAEHAAVLGEFTKLARLPGFRPGKAPQAIVVKRFAREIADEFKQKVVSKAYREGLEQQKLEVLNIVKIDEGTIVPGASAEITVTVDVRPEFVLPEYLGLPTQIASTAATDEEVAAIVEGLRGERADFKVAGRPAQKGDYVKLAYEGTVDGKPIAELVPDQPLYGKVPQTWEEVDGSQEGIIPGLGRALTGVTAGERKSIDVSFPGDFGPVPALAGRAAVYAVEVQEVRERVLPPLDAEFFKAQKVDDLAGLQSQIRTNLRLQKEQQNRAAQRNQITQALAERVAFEPPQSLVEVETQSVLRQFIEENMRRGVAADQFERDKQSLYEGARKAAASRVKVQFILAKIAEAEKLEVSERDFDFFIRREAARSGQSPDKVAKQLAKDRDALRSAQQSIIFDKAVDFLVSKATVSETTT